MNLHIAGCPMGYAGIQIAFLVLLLASQFRVANGQDLTIPVTVGRAQEMAPVESTKGQNALADAMASVPELEELNSNEPDNDLSLKSDAWAFVAVFEGPCHFSERSHDAAKSLLIYEGMQVAVDCDGRYEVSMIAEVPLTPVVMRMQLRVSELVRNERVDHGTITLAPIVMETSEETTDQQPSSTVRIRRTGYSHLLRRLMSENKGTASNLSFSRGGVTRFGTIPEAAKYSIQRTTKEAKK